MPDPNQNQVNQPAQEAQLQPQQIQQTQQPQQPGQPKQAQKEKEVQVKISKEDDEANKIVKVEKKEVTESPLLGDQAKAGETPEPEQIVLVKSAFWDKIAIFKLSVEEKALITENIIAEMAGKPLYWVLLIISTIIATFGLLQNSVAIIIGAMLLAPLLNPIKGLAFGITTGRQHYFWRALILLFFSTALAIFTAYVVSLIIPLKIETPEIIARTSPNLLDLFIAIAAGTIAILSLYFKKLSENIAGVAMAAAILPPLAVSGIELALNNIPAFAGSLFLFVTNLFAILAVGMIIFLLYGFYPAQKDSKQRVVRIGAILFVLLTLISIPLFSSLTKIADEIEIKSKASEIVQASLLEDFPGAKMDDFNLEEFDDQVVMFSGSLKIPNGLQFYVHNQEEIKEELEEGLKRSVNLELEIIPIVTIGEKLEEENGNKSEIEEEIEVLEEAGRG